MKDKFRNFGHLCATEREEVDFRVCFQKRGSTVGIIAPHGGRIEPQTSEIARAIAGTDFNLYCFEGMKPHQNADLHITSTNFREPRCMSMVAECDHVVAIHGLRERIEMITYVGGLDRKFGDNIREALVDAGFNAVASGCGPYAGLDPNNICNQGRRRRGVQLEITRALREDLTGEELSNFASAVRHAIKSEINNK